MALWLNVLELLFYAFMVWLAGHFVLFDIKLHQRKQAVLNLAGPLTDLGFNLSNLPSRRFSMPDTTHRDACVDTCIVLVSTFGSQVSFPNTPEYENFTGSFWSTQQEKTEPLCVFRPSVSRDVSAALLLSQYYSCKFAARSGGHAAFPGASSAPRGLSIWFKDMNEISLSEDKSVVSIGPGNTWVSVYATLESYGLAAVGARSGSIGVGGFVLGGSISYYSNLYGWACDNVESFEVVIANGSILHASNDSHPDLYWALRGGGNNFGLVTKFNLYTIPAPMMYGGPRVFPANSFPRAINAFVNVAKNSVVDPHAQQLLTFFRVFGQNRAIAELSYTKDDADPEIFRQYREIPAVSDSTKSMTLYEYADYLDQLSPFHLREVYWPVVVQLNEKFANWVMTTFYEMILELDGMSAQPVIVYQAITVPMLAKMNNFGGNPLGLDASKGPLHLMHVACWWYDETEDDKIYETINSFWDKVISKAEDEGIYNEFIYMNYASMFQDPISSYGVDNKRRLNRIANKYDPKGVFQKLQPGYFKIDFDLKSGAPNWRFTDRKLTASQRPKMDWGSEKGLIPSLILFAWVFFPDAVNVFPNERRDVI